MKSEACFGFRSAAWKLHCIQIEIYMRNVDVTHSFPSQGLLIGNSTPHFLASPRPLISVLIISISLFLSLLTTPPQKFPAEKALKQRIVTYFLTSPSQREINLSLSHFSHWSFNLWADAMRCRASYLRTLQQDDVLLSWTPEKPHLE